MPSEFHEPIDEHDAHILELPVQLLVAEVSSGAHDPVEILTTYGKKALKAHEDTNCLTEVMLSDALVWAKECNRDGPLAGVPVSLKDVSNCLGPVMQPC